MSKNQDNVKELLRSIRGLIHNMEKIAAASKNIADSEPDELNLNKSAERLNQVILPTALMFRKIEKQVEKWCDDRNSN